jgi:hypothetical protein
MTIVSGRDDAHHARDRPAVTAECAPLAAEIDAVQGVCGGTCVALHVIGAVGDRQEEVAHAWLRIPLPDV